MCFVPAQKKYADEKPFTFTMKNGDILKETFLMARPSMSLKEIWTVGAAFSNADLKIEGRHPDRNQQNWL